jgi:hypothetical protein
MNPLGLEAVSAQEGADHFGIQLESFLSWHGLDTPLVLRYYTVGSPWCQEASFMAQRINLKARMADLARKYRTLTARLSQIGFIWPGNVQRRMLTCGKQNCACQTDPDARHGPYLYWTSKEAQKTVSKLLPAQKAELYEEWINNRREMENIMREMYELSRQAAKIELRLRAETTKTTKKRRR